MQVWSLLGWADPLGKGMATHSSILAWRVPWTEGPDGLQSIESQSRTRLTWFSMHIVAKLKNYCLRETNQASVSESKKICHNFNLPFFHYVSLNNSVLFYCWFCVLSSFYLCTTCWPNILHIPYLLLDVSRSF